MNPRLYQAMDLLYLPLLELEQHLKQELVQNPFLEMREPEEEFAEQAEVTHRPVDLARSERSGQAGGIEDAGRQCGTFTPRVGRGAVFRFARCAQHGETAGQQGVRESSVHRPTMVGLGCTFRNPFPT